jgi:hypothetical protein
VPVEESGAVGPRGQDSPRGRSVEEAGAERDRLAAAAGTLGDTARQDNSSQAYRRSAAAYAQETAARIEYVRALEAAGADQAAVQAAKAEAVTAAGRATKVSR